MKHRFADDSDSICLNVFLYDVKTPPETVIRKTVKTGINDVKVFKLKSHVVLKELKGQVHG